MNIFNIFLFRSITRFIGINVRFYFFKLFRINKLKSELSNIAKNDLDLERASGQDFYNTLIGTIVLIAFFVIAASLIYS